MSNISPRRFAPVPTALLTALCLSAVSVYARQAPSSAHQRDGEVLVAALPPHQVGQHLSSRASAHDNGASGDRRPASDLVQTVRAATARFKDVAQAEAEGYSLMFGCVSGPDWGAMGLHYVNLALVGDGVLDPAKPEIVIYEPLPNGRLRLTGADYLVFAGAWHASNQATPQLGGQLLHLFESPNRYGLPDFYTLHVWAWKENPAGTYSNWHANVSCDAYSGQ